jgi:hypothetical protein
MGSQLWREMIALFAVRQRMISSDHDHVLSDQVFIGQVSQTAAVFPWYSFPTFRACFETILTSYNRIVDGVNANRSRFTNLFSGHDTCFETKFANQMALS